MFSSISQILLFYGGDYRPHKIPGFFQLGKMESIKTRLFRVTKTDAVSK